MIKVFGHKAPDTDTTCSAIVYSWFLNQNETPAKAYILGTLNKETEFVLKKFNVTPPELLESLDKGKKIIVVDTNNKEELPQGIEQAEIVEIIDHHKLTGTLKTDKPIPVIIKPVASTATIIWKRIKHTNVQITKQIAGLLVSAILSDTLNCTSPTTTPKDKSAIDELATIAGINVKNLCEEMFSAKSDLTGMGAKEILLSDSKIFEMGGKKIRVSVLETTNPQNALKITGDLQKGMSKLKEEESLDHIFFFAVDILKTRATLVRGSEEEKEIAEKTFSKKFVGEKMTLPGVVSRKKQIIPSLERFFSS